MIELGRMFGVRARCVLAAMAEESKSDPSAGFRPAGWSLATPHVLYQHADLFLHFNKHSLKGKTTLWLLWDDEQTLGSTLHLHHRQCIVDHVTVNSTPCSFVHLDPLKMIVTTKPNEPHSYCGEEMDINYRAALEITRLGELQIQLPSNLTSSKLSLPPLPSRVQKEIFTKVEKLTKFQQDLEISNSDKRRLLLTVTVEYHLKASLKSWGGWSMILKNVPMSKTSDSVVTQCWTRHGDEALFCCDGVRTWLPCIDDPSKQTVFDVSISVPKYTRQVRSERYRVMASGLMVSSNSSVNHSNFITYRFITPNCIPVSSYGIYIGLIKETFNTPLYLVQGQVWIGDNSILAEQSDPNDLRNSKLPDHKMENSHLSEQVTHTLLGLDAAVRHVHKGIHRMYPYKKCSIIFIPELDSEFLSFDAFFLVNSDRLHTDSFIYLETSTHLLLLNAYLSSWFKGALFLENYSSECLHFGAIGFLIDEYVEHIFGADEARYRFWKEYNAVIEYEKASCSASLTIPFPEDYFRLGEFYLKYLRLKSTIIFHIICNRAGGHPEVLQKAIKNMVKSEELQKPSKTGNMPPPETPGNTGFTVPLYPGHWSASPLSPMLSPPYSPYSPPGTPTYTLPSSPPVTSERKRSDSMTSTGEPEVVDEVSLSWKMDPNDPIEAASAALYQPKAPMLARENSFPPPPPLAHLSSSSSIIDVSMEKLLWATEFRGNSSIAAFIADVKDISGSVSSELNESFLEQFVANPGCMFLRAGVSVNSKHKKVDVALHQVGFRNGVVDSARFIYKDKVPIHVVEAEVWQYSRRVDGKAQIVTFSLHTKPRRQGGRRKLTAEELAIGASAGPTLETISLSEEFLAIPSVGSSHKNRENLGQLKYLCSPADVNGGRVQAQALAAIRAGSSSSSSSTSSASQSVQFISIDPEIHWIREVHFNSPDDLLIEQLYADMDIIGQITALKSLAQPHISHQTIPTQILRLRAIKDVILAGTNEGNVVHTLAVRIEAIYALATWQNAHAPAHPRPRNENSSSYTWAGMDILLGCLRGMFTDINKASSFLAFDDDLRSHYLPHPNDFTDHTKTQLRSAVLLALSSIRSGSGETPPDIVEELLHFAENNDNNADIKEENSHPNPITYDDGHYCAILLYCLSKVSCNPMSPLSMRYLKRIIDICKYYLHRESIITAAQFYEEEGNAGAGISRAKGYYMMGNEHVSLKTDSKSLVGRGYVTAIALHCLCNAEIQLDTSTLIEGDSRYEPFNFRQYITSPGTSGENSKGKSSETSTPIVPLVSDLVRASALDCLLRLIFAKHIARLLNNGEVTSPTSKREERTQVTQQHDNSTKKSPSPADAISLTLSVIINDPSRQVRRYAALSLLYVLQDRPSFLPYKILSLAEPLQTYNWFDQSGLVVLTDGYNHRRRYSSEHRQAVTKSTSNSIKSSLKKLWNFIASNPIAIYDQPIRCSLLFAWLYVFYSRKNGKQRIPNSLIVSSSLTNESPADESNPSGSAAASVTSTGPYTVVIQPSYRERFPLLPYQGPLVIRDPIESCSDLEEAMRVGHYGRQIMKVDNQQQHRRVESGGNGSVLKITHKGLEDISGKRKNESTVAADTAAGPKRPKLVKFIMS